jgi:hypothetical protein
MGKEQGELGNGQWAMDRGFLLTIIFNKGLVIKA